MKNTILKNGTEFAAVKNMMARGAIMCRDLDAEHPQWCVAWETSSELTEEDVKYLNERPSIMLSDGQVISLSEFCELGGIWTD